MRLSLIALLYMFLACKSESSQTYEPTNDIAAPTVEETQAIDSLSSGDILAVTRLSILCISVQSLLEVLFELNDIDVTLEVVQQKFISKDTHTLDELLLYLIEFIDDIKIEKQVYGISKAKANGVRLGRPPKLTQQQVLKAIELKHNQTSQNVASKFGVGRSTLLRHIAKQKKAS